jgi:hypothetical protein
LELTDVYRISKTTLQPYLAIDCNSNDSQLLLGITALNELKVSIDCENHQWQYKLDKSNIWLEFYQRFQKQVKTSNVYTLVEINYLIPSNISSLIDKLSDSLKKNYSDVFSDQNAKKLALYCNIDLAIELQPGKESLYRPIYLLLF